MKRISISINQDELNVVRRKLSFQFDKDLTSEETIQFLIEREYDIAKKISFTKKPTHIAEKSDIKNSFLNGITSTEAMKEFGISRSTFFRYKARERNLIGENNEKV
jgi:DNA invertase Pin-like site-specific DNA recombinase